MCVILLYFYMPDESLLRSFMCFGLDTTEIEKPCYNEIRVSVFDSIVHYWE